MAGSPYTLDTARQILLGKAATHTALTVASFFAALREVVGPAYDELEISEVRALLAMPTDLGRRVIPEVAAAMLARERREARPE